MPEPLTPKEEQYLDSYRRTGNISTTAAEFDVRRQIVQRAIQRARNKGHDVPAPNGQLPAIGSVAEFQSGIAQPSAASKHPHAITPGRVMEQTGKGNEKSSIVYVEREPKSLDEALELYNVDRDVWRVKTWEVGEWNGLAKLKDSEGVEFVQVCTLYRIKITFERFPQVQALKSILETVVAKAERKAPKWTTNIRTPKSASGLLSLNIPDLHLGKLAWAPETGGPSYDVAIAGQVFRDAVRDLVEKAKRNQWRPEKVLFPIGNDFLNSDRMIGGKAGATTKGTLQDEDGRWQKSFCKGFELAEEAIAGIAEALQAPVEVVIVPGNHDEERIFYVGHSLEVAFRRHKAVTIDNRPQTRKYFAHKKVLIGMSHGDKEPVDQLPLLMAAQYPLTEFVTLEHYLGHLHQRRGRSFDTHSETGNILVRTFSSLSPPDSWHASKGYVMNVRSAEALFYNSEGRFDGSAIHYPA